MYNIIEIGSEYWKYEGPLDCDNEEFWKFGNDNVFTLSGRTAIYYCIMDILQKRKIKKVYFPSYSCQSMEQPFKDLGIEIVYYDVYFDNKLKYSINKDEDCDIFFAMNYFGYSESNMDKYIQSFKKRDIIVIEDITQSILSNKKFSNNSDYVVASLRKWFPVMSGGIAVNVDGKFSKPLSDITNFGVIVPKQLAMENKKTYIEKSMDKKHLKNIKNEYLNQYSQSGNVLENDYKNYAIDEESLNILMKISLQDIIETRKANVEHIYNRLKDNPNINFLFNKYKDDDCLLFVPIILDNSTRNSLRQFLIQNNVYLPVHWPSEKDKNNIFDRELSLICDQRYNVQQIECYLDLIDRFF